MPQSKTEITTQEIHNKAERRLRAAGFKPIRQFKAAKDQSCGPGEVFEIWVKGDRTLFVQFYANAGGLEVYDRIRGNTWATLEKSINKTPPAPVVARVVPGEWRPVQITRDLKVRDLTSEECQRLMVHSHDHSLERRAAYLLKAYSTPEWDAIRKEAGAAFGAPFYKPERAREIEAWIAAE